MRGVLIVAHASREKSARESFQTIVTMVRAQIALPVESACTGMQGEGIELGLQALAKQGVDEIRVIPYFLFSGAHVQKGLPEEIARFQQKNPMVKVTLGKGLGTDSRLAEILIDRILEIGEERN